MALLELHQLKKYFATQKAVDDISLSIGKGDIFGLLGPNGAGKTTLIRMITGIFYPDEGEIIFDGKKFDPLNDVAHIGYMPEERGLYKKMKIGEQTLYLARLKGLSRPEAMKKIKEWFEKFEMQTWWNKKVEDLSKGMQQKLQFADHPGRTFQRSRPGKQQSDQRGNLWAGPERRYDHFQYTPDGAGGRDM
jgi:ABC-2 type transport system ATP-binding protein